MSENNEMELIGTALQSFDRVAAGLALLEKNYKGMLYEVDTAIGMAHAKAARKAIRDPRYELEKIRKDAKAPLLALGKRLDSEAARITNTLMELENPIHEQIKYEEDRIEKEKPAKAAAEKARADAIQARINSIRQWPIDATGKNSAEIDLILQSASDYEVTDADFAEWADEAKSALMTSIAALQGIHQAKVSQEAEAERVRLGMLELAKLKAEAAERERLAAEERAKQEAIDRAAREAQDKIDREARAKADAEAKALRDAEAEALRLERERIAAEEAAAKKLRDEETARQNAILAAERKKLADEQAETNRKNEEERQKQAAEAGRIVAAREQLERDQEAARKAAEPKPEPAKVNSMRTVERPTAAQLIALVAGHYNVSFDMAEMWLKHIKWSQAAA